MSKCARFGCLLLVMGMMMALVESRPVDYEMKTVSSLRREARQQPRLFATEVSDLLTAAPIKRHDKKFTKNVSGKTNEGGMYKQFGSDADGEKGYLKKSYSNGNHGYKNFDTFHKQIGDRYGLEQHGETGKALAADSDKHQRQVKKKHTKRKHNADHEGAGTDDVESYYSGDDGGDYSGYIDGGDGETSSYNDGSNEGYSESYSSSDDGEGGDGGEAFSSGESYASSGEDGSYY